MRASEFIHIKNQMDICHFYSYRDYYETFISDERKDVHYLAARLLVPIFCQLEKENKYPESTELNDLIIFSVANPAAFKLASYLNNIPGYDENLYCHQPQETYYEHQIASLGFNELKHRIHKFSEYTTDYCLDNVTSLYGYENDIGQYLQVVSNGIEFTVEKLYSYKKNTFKIKDVMFEDIEVNMLINIINYVSMVKELNLDNIQAAYNFLGKKTAQEI